MAQAQNLFWWQGLQITEVEQQSLSMEKQIDEQRRVTERSVHKLRLEQGLHWSDFGLSADLGFNYMLRRYWRRAETLSCKPC